MYLFVISAKPTLTSQVPPQFAELGDHHKVKFSFNGTGPFKFRVKRDGKEIPTKDGRVKLNTFDDHGSLVFSGTAGLKMPYQRYYIAGLSFFSVFSKIFLIGHRRYLKSNFDNY